MINKIKGEDLQKRNIEDVWRDGKEFRVIREKINNNNCNKCNYFNICHGGCRIFDINAKECVHWYIKIKVNKTK